MKFWDNKSGFRKSLSLENRTLLVLQTLVEDENISYSSALERLIKEPNLYFDILDKLKLSYLGIKND